ATEEQRIKARPLPVEAVRLVGGPLKAAQDADAAFLLTVEPDRALAALRTAAGFEGKGRPLGGWGKEGGGSLAGHISGHLLSALSLMYAATGDARFKERADYMVNELVAIQERYADGYIGAQQDSKGTPGRDIYKQISAGDVRSRGEEDLNGL